MSPPGLKPPVHRYKNTAMAKGPKAPKPKTAGKAPKAIKPQFLNQSPMDKSALKPPAAAKATKPPAIKKPKLPTLPTPF